jgi:hypothetical protein
MLPELHPLEGVPSAVASARFHLRVAARLGHPLALLTLAKWHSGTGLQPNSSQFQFLFQTLIKVLLYYYLAFDDPIPCYA